MYLIVSDNFYETDRFLILETMLTAFKNT